MTYYSNTNRPSLPTTKSKSNRYYMGYVTIEVNDQSGIDWIIVDT